MWTGRQRVTRKGESWGLMALESLMQVGGAGRMTSGRCGTHPFSEDGPGSFPQEEVGIRFIGHL